MGDFLKHLITWVNPKSEDKTQSLTLATAISLFLLRFQCLIYYSWNSESVNAPPNAAIKGLKTLDKVLSFYTYWEGPLCQTPSWPTMAQGRTRAILMVFYKLQHWSWEASTNKSEGTRASISHRAQQTVPHSRYNSSSSCYLFISCV